MPHFSLLSLFCKITSLSLSLLCLCLFLVFGGYGLVVCGYDLVGEIMRHGGDVGLIWWVSVATRSWLFFLDGVGFFLS